MQNRVFNECVFLEACHYYVTLFPRFPTYLPSEGGWDTCIQATEGVSMCLRMENSSTGTTGEPLHLISSPSDVYETCSGTREGAMFPLPLHLHLHLPTPLPLLLPPPILSPNPSLILLPTPI